MSEVPQDFVVKFEGLTIDEPQRSRLNAALQGAVLRELAKLELIDKRIVIPGKGLVNGIVIRVED